MTWQWYSKNPTKKGYQILYFLSLTSSVLSATWHHPDDFEALTEYKRGEVRQAEWGVPDDPTLDKNVFSFFPYDYNARVGGCILLFSQMTFFMFSWIAELYEYNYWSDVYDVEEKLDDDICPEDFKTAVAVDMEKSAWKMWTVPSVGETEFLEDEPMLVRRQEQVRYANWAAKEHNANKKLHELKRSRQWKQEKERRRKERRNAERKEKERKEREKVERQKREQIQRKAEIERQLDREDERRRIRDLERAERKKEEAEERKKLEKEEKERKRKERIRKRKELIKVDKTQEDDVEQNPADDLQEVQTMKEMATEVKTMKEQKTQGSAEPTTPKPLELTDREQAIMRMVFLPGDKYEAVQGPIDEEERERKKHLEAKERAGYAVDWEITDADKGPIYKNEDHMSGKYLKAKQKKLLEKIKAHEQAAAPAPPTPAPIPTPPAPPAPVKGRRAPQDFHEVRLREQAKDIWTLDAEEHEENLRKKRARDERRRKAREKRKKEEE